MALALALSALVLAPVASAKVTPPVTTYLAAGDSNAFGYTQQKFEENEPNEAPKYFADNYPNEYAKKTLKKENKGIVVVNNGCPGETTDSFFGTGPLGAATDPTGTPACTYHFEKGLPLHNSLGTLSQLEDSISVLNPCFTSASVCAPPHEIKAVTLDLGSNDELATVAACKAEVKTEFEETGKSQYEGEENEEPLPAKIHNSIQGCLAVHAGPSFERIITNTVTAIALMRKPEYGNYTGPITVVGFYNPKAIVLPGSDALQVVLNQEMKKALHESGLSVKFTNPMPTFNPIPEQGKKRDKSAGKVHGNVQPERHRGEQSQMRSKPGERSGRRQDDHLPVWGRR